VMRRICGADRN